MLFSWIFFVVVFVLVWVEGLFFCFVGVFCLFCLFVLGLFLFFWVSGFFCCCCCSKPKLIISTNISHLTSNFHDAEYLVPGLGFNVFPDKNIRNDNIYTQQQETHLFMCKEKIRVGLRKLQWVLLSGKGTGFPMCVLCMDSETVNGKICFRST